MIGTLKKNRKSVFREVGLEMDTDNIDTMTSPTVDHALASQTEAERITRLAPLDTRTSVGQGVTTQEAGDEGDGASSDDQNETSDVQKMPQTQHQDSPLSEASSPGSPTSKTPWYAKLATGRRPRVRAGSNAPPSPFKPLSTVTMLALAVAVMAPLAGRMNRETVGVADAGVVVHRAGSPTDVCARWAQQSTSRQAPSPFVDTMLAPWYS